MMSDAGDSIASSIFQLQVRASEAEKGTNMDAKDPGLENKATSVTTLAELAAVSQKVIDLKKLPEYKLASETCCDQCCDDYVCSSD